MRSRIASAVLPAKRHQPAVAQRDRALLRAWRRAPRGWRRARRRASSAGRSRSDSAGRKPEHRDRRAARQRRAQFASASAARTSGVSPNITRISSAPARDAPCAPRAPHARCRAAPLLEDLRLGRKRARLARDRIVIGPDHHGDVAAAGLHRRAEHMREQRAAADRVQHLRPRRAHARALAGRQHDRQARSPSSRSDFPLSP